MGCQRSFLVDCWSEQRRQSCETAAETTTHGLAPKRVRPEAKWIVTRLWTLCEIIFNRVSSVKSRAMKACCCFGALLHRKRRGPVKLLANEDEKRGHECAHDAADDPEIQRARDAQTNPDCGEAREPTNAPPYGDQQQAVEAMLAAQRAVLASAEANIALLQQRMEAAGLSQEAIDQAIGNMRDVYENISCNAAANELGAGSLAAQYTAPEIPSVATPAFAWRECGGQTLEPFLVADAAGGVAPVRLVRAQYLIEIADAGERLRRRQDMPEEAFYGLEQLWGLSRGSGNMLRIIVISHP